jgi:hypothetical protein
MSHHNKLIHT